jgi:hypothetical protein
MKTLSVPDISGAAQLHSQSFGRFRMIFFSPAARIFLRFSHGAGQVAVCSLLIACALNATRNPPPVWPHGQLSAKYPRVWKNRMPLKVLLFNFPLKVSPGTYHSR